MKFLIIADLHHPEELARAQSLVVPKEGRLLFPPSQGAYFWTRSLRKLGHEVDAFVRSDPAFFGWRSRHLHRFTGKRGPGMLGAALAHRAPRLHLDYRIRNRRLLNKVRQYQPDVILLTGGNRVIFPETIAALKAEQGCKIVYLSGVSPIVFSSAIERAAAPQYDLVIVNDYYHGIQWLELGARQMEALPLSACDPDFHHSYPLTPEEQAEYGCNVGFVGTLLPLALYSTRVEALEAVSDLGLGIWSVHDIPASLKPYNRGPALGEKMLRVLCGSKIQINPHGNFMRYGGNMRLFEAAACGVFQITDDLPGTSRWFSPGENIVTYRDIAQLRQLTAYYLQHEDERCAIAHAAQEHVYKHHTYDQRMATLVDLVHE